MLRRTRGQGEGCILKRRADNRWEARLDLGWESGKRRRKSFFGRSRREVAELLNEAIAARRRGAPTPIGRRTVSQHMRTWLSSIQPPAVSIRTHQAYELLSRVHIEPALGHVQISKLNHEIVQGFLNEKARAGLSIATVKHIRTTLRQALSLAVKGNLISLNPATLVKLPKSRRPKITPLTEEETRLLLAAAKGTRLEALMVVALRLALRRGELLALQWSDVHFDEQKLYIERSIQRVPGQPLTPGPLKTEESRRDVLMPDEVTKALRAHRIAQAKARLKAGATWNDQDLVFANRVGRPFEPRAVDMLFKALLKKAGLPDSTRFHDCRHTCLTTLLENGADLYDVSKLAGHSSIATTADMYAHWTRNMKRSLVDKMNTLAR